jgi:hypothetical protein
VPARLFRQFAEAARRGLPALYEHLALSIAMDAELRAFAVHPNERPLALLERGTLAGLNRMWNQYVITIVRTSCTGRPRRAASSSDGSEAASGGQYGLRTFSDLSPLRCLLCLSAPF